MFSYWLEVLDFLTQTAKKKITTNIQGLHKYDQNYMQLVDNNFVTYKRKTHSCTMNN